MNAQKQAKAASLIDVAVRLGLLPLKKGSRTFCKCPFHSDNTPSMILDDHRFHCFGCGADGDAIELVKKLTGLGFLEACSWIVGGNAAPRTNHIARLPKSPVKRHRKPMLPNVRRGTKLDISRLAELRKLPLNVVQSAAERGVVLFGEIYGHPCWIVTDDQRVNAQARRMDGLRWSNGAKSLTLPNSWAKWPIGLSQANSRIIIAEGGPDFLAAHLFLVEHGWSPVAMIGASLQIHPAALPLFSGAAVIIAPHNDPEGQKAARKWAAQLAGYANSVSFLQTPQKVKDLNEVISEGLAPLLKEERLPAPS